MKSGGVARSSMIPSAIFHIFFIHALDALNTMHFGRMRFPRGSSSPCDPRRTGRRYGRVGLPPRTESPATLSRALF